MKKTVTRTEKSLYEFTASELCKRLRLPDTARIFVKTDYQHTPGNDVEIDDLGQSLLVDVEAIA